MADDPRQLGGDIAGPGGPHDRDAVIVDTTNAVLLEHSTVALIQVGRNGEMQENALSLLLEGRVNKSADRVKVLFLLSGDGAAAIITEIAGIAGREGGQFAADFLVAVEARQQGGDET